MEFPQWIQLICGCNGWKSLQSDTFLVRCIKEMSILNPIFSGQMITSELMFTCFLEVTLLIRSKAEWAQVQMENGSTLWECYPETFCVTNYPHFGWVKKSTCSSILNNSQLKLLKPVLLCLTPVGFNLGTFGFIKFQGKNPESIVLFGFLASGDLYLQIQGMLSRAF